MPAQHGPGEAEASGRHVHDPPGCPGYHCRHARAGHTPPSGPGRQRGAAAGRPAPAGDPPDHDARDLLAAASAKFDALADATDNLHERGFWARAQEQTARYAATLAYVRTLEDGIPPSWEHIHYTRPEVDQAEAVITWHGELIRSYAVQAASEKVTRLANETITMLREKREKVVKEDGSIAARNVIARLGKGELRTDAALREQVLDVLVVHRHLIPTARRGHYMMVIPHD